MTDAFARVKAILGPESANMFAPQTVCEILINPQSPFARDDADLLEIALRLIHHVREGVLGESEEDRRGVLRDAD